MAVPFLDAPLVSFSTNFNTRGVADPESFGLLPEQIARYTPLHEAWLAAWNGCNVQGGKCSALVKAKDTAKANLLPVARALYSVVQNSSLVSDANKTLMGVTIRGKRARMVAPPELAPLLTVISVTGRAVACKINDGANPTTRRKPRSAAGATLLTFVGPTAPPAGSPTWKLHKQTGKNQFTVEFPTTVEPGATCWVSAQWYSRRGAYSPACPPIRVFLGVGPSAIASGTKALKRAA